MDSYYHKEGCNLEECKYLIMRLKICSIVFLLISFVAAKGQNPEGVFLKWKIQPSESLIYRTIMEETDRSENIDSSDILSLLRIAMDSANKKDKKLIKELKEMYENEGTITKLTSKGNGNIGIEMFEENSKPSDSDKVMLRGEVSENGEIQSFYLNAFQKNLIAVFFELPNKIVKVGDEWKLEINLVSMDQNFICDSSFSQNKVTLTELKREAGETIAVLKYDIVEFVSGKIKRPFNNTEKRGNVKMLYTATAEFSIERGRWVSYKGIMSGTSVGLTGVNITKKFCLYPNELKKEE